MARRVIRLDRWLVLIAWLVALVGAGCGPNGVQLAEGRAIADRLAAQKVAEQERQLQPGRPGLRLALGDYEVTAREREAGNEPGYHFLYVHRHPSIGLGPGQSHFSIWVSRVDGKHMLVPGR
jgi:hypothetical protein